MNSTVSRFFILLITVSLLVLSGADVVVASGQTTVTLDLTGGSVVPPTPSSSTLIITADDAVKQIGYTVNGVHNAESVPIPLSGTLIVIIPDSLPIGTLLNATFDFAGFHKSKVGLYFSEDFPDHSTPMTISVHLSLKTVIPPITPPEGGVGEDPEPEPTPDTPEVTPTPTVTPTEEPTVTPTDTPANPDTPGSDEPYVPILPPAGSVYNIAGTIPLAAGFLLLFLLVFWRRKVYRILKKHAKQHGEKPERKQLRATADAIIQLIRDEEKYPKWRKNSELTTRLSADIVSALDEMQYPPTIPRDAVVADIIKSAKGRINRHRL